MKKLLLLFAMLIGVISISAQNADDFATMGSKADTSYGTRNSTKGWTATNSALVMINSKVAPTLNGKTSAKGVLTSPTLTGGIKTLSFKYQNTFSESNGVSVRVDIKQNGTVVKTETLSNTNVTQNTEYSFTSENFGVEGDFQIVITNLCPSNNSKNKDRVSIYNLTWISNSGDVDPNKETLTTFEFTSSIVNAKLGEEVEFPTLNVSNTEALDEVVYSCDNPAVAEVNALTGAVTIKGVGTATITAYITNSATFNDATAKYELNVESATVTPGPTQGGWVLVKNLNDLKSNDKIIIAGQKKDDGSWYAIGAQAKNNRKAEVITVKDNTVISPSEAVEQIVINRNGTSNISFKVSDGTSIGYLYASTVGSNYMRTSESEVFANVAIAESGVATIAFAFNDENNTTRYIQFNASSKVFSCYKTESGQNDVYIFKYVEVENVTYTATVTLNIVGAEANNLTASVAVASEQGSVDASEFDLYLGETLLGSADTKFEYLPYAPEQLKVRKGNTKIETAVEGALDLTTVPEIAKVNYYKENDVLQADYHFAAPAGTAHLWYVEIKNGEEWTRLHRWIDGNAAHLIDYVGMTDGETHIIDESVNFTVRFSIPFEVRNEWSTPARVNGDNTIQYVAAASKQYNAEEVGKEYEPVGELGTSGVADVVVDSEAAVEFYTLQGVKVEGELTPGLYIRRQGTKAAKVLVK